jgi:hypothetical protein
VPLWDRASLALLALGLVSVEEEGVLALSPERQPQREAVPEVLVRSRQSTDRPTRVVVVVVLRQARTSPPVAQEAAVEVVLLLAPQREQRARSTRAEAEAAEQPTSQEETAALVSSCFASLLQCPSQPALD